MFFFLWFCDITFFFPLQKKKRKQVKRTSKGSKGHNHFLFVFLLLVKTLPWTTEIGTNKKKQHQQRELLAFFADNTKSFVSWKETSKKSWAYACRQKKKKDSNSTSLNSLNENIGSITVFGIQRIVFGIQSLFFGYSHCFFAIQSLFLGHNKKFFLFSFFVLF